MNRQKKWSLLNSIQSTFSSFLAIASVRHLGNLENSLGLFVKSGTDIRDFSYLAAHTLRLSASICGHTDGPATIYTSETELQSGYARASTLDLTLFSLSTLFSRSAFHGAVCARGSNDTKALRHDACSHKNDGD